MPLIAQLQECQCDGLEYVGPDPAKYTPERVKQIREQVAYLMRGNVGRYFEIPEDRVGDPEGFMQEQTMLLLEEALHTVLNAN